MAAQKQQQHQLESLSSGSIQQRWPLPSMETPRIFAGSSSSISPSSDRSPCSNASLSYSENLGTERTLNTPFSIRRRSSVQILEDLKEDMETSPEGRGFLHKSGARLPSSQEHISPISSKNRFSFANLASFLELDACESTTANSGSSTMITDSAVLSTPDPIFVEARGTHSHERTQNPDHYDQGTTDMSSSPIESPSSLLRSKPLTVTGPMVSSNGRNGDSIVPKVGDDLGSIRPLFEHPIHKPSRLPRPKSSHTPSASFTDRRSHSLFTSHPAHIKSYSAYPLSTPSLPLSVLSSPIACLLDASFFAALHGDAEAVKCILKQHQVSSASKKAPMLLQDDRVDLSGSDYLDGQFIVVARLGGGAFSDAVRVKSVVDGCEYAVKKTRQAFQGFKDALKKLQEVEVWSMIETNPWCIPLIKSWIQFGFIYIQMELCEGGNLATYLDEFCKDEPIDEPRIWRILADIAQGLRHIHQRNIVHLDIKPGNILISRDGTLKIGDFGMAARAPVPKGADREGDRSYLAPEVLSDAAVGCAADIFSLGLILLEISANIILPENGPVWQHLREGDFSDIPLTDRSPPLTDFIRSMMHPNPNVRPTMQDVLAHPILASMILSRGGV
ncbi:hypothetical protein BSLG_005067 [Batrachochytrium salamandrivorans]|nr:hypothetical protein BSLG_005067 [Batrachochytrium salamandrivorans]